MTQSLRDAPAAVASTCFAPLRAAAGTEPVGPGCSL
jgi:hypothetical protein